MPSLCSSYNTKDKEATVTVLTLWRFRRVLLCRSLSLSIYTSLCLSVCVSTFPYALFSQSTSTNCMIVSSEIRESVACVPLVLSWSQVWLLLRWCHDFLGTGVQCILRRKSGMDIGMHRDCKMQLGTTSSFVSSLACAPAPLNRNGCNHCV